MSTSKGDFSPSPNTVANRVIPAQEMATLFLGVLPTVYSWPIFHPLSGKALEYGDFAYLGVEDSSEDLSPERTGTDSLFIARAIKRKFEKRRFAMIRKIRIYDSGILTFKLEGHWMAERIRTMLTNGIDTWAPPVFGKAVFGFPAILASPTNRVVGGGTLLRASFMNDALERLYHYSGAAVGRMVFDDNKALCEATSLYNSALDDEEFDKPTLRIVQLNDLASLWYGAKVQEADFLVYMTPYSQTWHMKECFRAAAEAGWFPREWESLDTPSCCPFRTISDTPVGCHSFWDRLQGSNPEAYQRLQTLCTDFGYNDSTFLECAIKFSCLKRGRMAECILSYEEDFAFEGDSLASLLETRSLVRSLITPPFASISALAGVERGLAGVERELGLHLLRFTEVVYTACFGFLPDCLCEYLFALSKLFTSCHREVWKVSSKENVCWMCMATTSVMDKCFDLLGIRSSLREYTNEFREWLDGNKVMTPDRVLPVRYLNSRVEIISMSMAGYGFDEGYVTGSVTLRDKFLVANGDGWVKQDEIGNCHVCCFQQEWYQKPLTLAQGSIIRLGNSTCIRSLPFSNRIELELLIKVTTKKRDKTIYVLNKPVYVDMMNFWNDGLLSADRFTLKARGTGKAVVYINFVAMKEAIDTSMELTFEPKKDMRLRGLITASYEDDVLKGPDILGQYRVCIFEADSTRYSSDVHILPLFRSALAVPANGRLKVRAYFEDADTGAVIVKDVTHGLDVRQPVTLRVGDPNVAEFVLYVKHWCLGSK